MGQKIELMKFDNSFGVVELTDAGEIRFERDTGDFLKQWIEDIQTRQGLRGPEAFNEFLRDFQQSSYWFKDLSPGPTMTVGTGDVVLGTIGWSGDQYVVKGMAIPTKELASKLASIEHFSGLEGAELVKALPEYFAGTDKWARLAG